jgi:predicted DNA-binding protein
MHQLNALATPNIQFPLRLSHDLSNRLNQTAKSTRIPKTTLGRIAIQSLLDQIEQKGISLVLEQASNESR